jgi:DNA-binding transcriptional regulator YhcF (GntR family)
MTRDLFSFTINNRSDIPKYQQLVNAVNNAISENLLQKGDALPSVNKICNSTKLSRDTVFKSYTILKENGVIESVPNKGYYIANQTKKVLLILDTFKAYKEVVYHSFINNISENTIVDLQFHHYNIDNFKTILNNSKGKYYKYIVMPFDDKEVADTLSDIDNNKLLLIDWSVHSKKENNYIFQDFGKAFYNALKDAVDVFRKYKKLVFLYPTYTYHPKETLTFFKKYCKEFNLDYQIETNPTIFSIEKNVAYVSTSDRMLGVFLEQCRIKKLEPGKNVGFLSYNETPMKKFIYKGISVVSTNFEELGAKVAEFVNKDSTMQHYVPTKLILRESL